MGRVLCFSGGNPPLPPELRGLGTSSFTHSLVRGLEGEADTDGDGVITINELFHHLRRNRLCP